MSEVRVTITERSDKVIRATLFSGLERVLEWVIRFTASWIGGKGFNGFQILNMIRYSFYLLCLEPSWVEIPISHELRIVHTNNGALKNHILESTMKKKVKFCFTRYIKIKSCCSSAKIDETRLGMRAEILLLSIVKSLYFTEIINSFNFKSGPIAVLRIDSLLDYHIIAMT